MASEVPVAAPGRFFDGASAKALPVSLRLADSLEVTGDGLRREWSLLDLRAEEAPRPLMRIGPAGSPERVECADAAMAEALIARCPDLDRVEAGGISAVRLVVWSVVAGLSVLLVAIFGIPNAAGVLAPLVPASIEAKLGAVTESQIAKFLGDPPFCEAPAGRAALDSLVARLSAGAAFLDPPKVTVRRHAVANAVALPGGHVVILSSIIDKAISPDEFAGILGHEFGHVASRDPTRSLIAAGGTSFLLSLILGDLTGSTLVVALAQAAIVSEYSRDAERAADAYGVAALGRAGGDGAALASILERIDEHPESEGSPFDFLRNHPFTKERAATIRASATRSGRTKPLLSDEEWQALRNICSTEKKKLH